MTPQVLEPTTEELHDFVTKSTLNFFKILDLPDNFLEQDLIKWGNDETYQKTLVDALIQGFNSAITHNEEQKQFLVQFAKDHRQMLSMLTKTEAIDISSN